VYVNRLEEKETVKNRKIAKVAFKKEKRKQRKRKKCHVDVSLRTSLLLLSTVPTVANS